MSKFFLVNQTQLYKHPVSVLNVYDCPFTGNSA